MTGDDVAGAAGCATAALAHNTQRQNARHTRMPALKQHGFPQRPPGTGLGDCKDMEKWAENCWKSGRGRATVLGAPRGATGCGRIAAHCPSRYGSAGEHRR
jgi:hypothetical protein